MGLSLRSWWCRRKMRKQGRDEHGRPYVQIFDEPIKISGTKLLREMEKEHRRQRDPEVVARGWLEAMGFEIIEDPHVPPDTILIIPPTTEIPEIRPLPLIQFYDEIAPVTEDHWEAMGFERLDRLGVCEDATPPSTEEVFRDGEAEI